MNTQLTMTVLMTILTLTSLGQNNDHKSVHSSADKVFIKSLEERQIGKVSIIFLYPHFTL
ncbi:Uncharacterised protein [Sphingobacterium multivorum]|uniref:Uncharacterized protein n=1 Tax=Sphingobacterium multivorum TaxID=28454 RepID=A0A654DPB7_SPHMU|nr:hypothetical protein HMPREF3127_10395 [Sphingobacterium sp. HMSC13C05]SUJ31710.1 Uncharacterised protein [Sphingobacterium multivorum]HAF33469.1 hypothetical protein [Sphingobacterium sp.]VXD07060.1 conserved hypothetical protein [Sphingobacterium multivorum]HAU52394.1 hypothetical protein [Sphingobacterium sp.]